MFDVSKDREWLWLECGVWGVGCGERELLKARELREGNVSFKLNISSFEAYH